MVIDDGAPDDGPSFGGLRYSSVRGLLLDAAGEMVPLRRQALEVFRYLAARADGLVTREELMRTVWGRVRVTDDSLTQCVCEIRRALGSEGRGILRTLPRRGYLLVPDAPARTLPGPAGNAGAVGRDPVRAMRTAPVRARRPPSSRCLRRRARSAANALAGR